MTWVEQRLAKKTRGKVSWPLEWGQQRRFSKAELSEQQENIWKSCLVWFGNAKREHILEEYRFDGSEAKGTSLSLSIGLKQERNLVGVYGCCDVLTLSWRQSFLTTFSRTDCSGFFACCCLTFMAFESNLSIWNKTECTVGFNEQHFVMLNASSRIARLKRRSLTSYWGSCVELWFANKNRKAVNGWKWSHMAKSYWRVPMKGVDMKIILLSRDIILSHILAGIFASFSLNHLCGYIDFAAWACFPKCRTFKTNPAKGAYCFQLKRMFVLWVAYLIRKQEIRKLLERSTCPSIQQNHIWYDKLVWEMKEKIVSHLHTHIISFTSYILYSTVLCCMKSIYLCVYQGYRIIQH